MLYSWKYSLTNERKWKFQLASLFVSYLMRHILILYFFKPSRCPATERRYYRKFAGCSLSPATDSSYWRLLQFSHKAAPSFKLLRDSIIWRCSGLYRAPECGTQIHNGKINWFKLIYSNVLTQYLSYWFLPICLCMCVHKYIYICVYKTFHINILVWDKIKRQYKFF